MVVALPSPTSSVDSTAVAFNGSGTGETTEYFRNEATGGILQLSTVAGPNVNHVLAAAAAATGSPGVWWSGDAGETWKRVSNARTVMPTSDGVALAGAADLELIQTS